MRRANIASLADDPKTRADRILSDLIGGDYDLLSEKGLTDAVEAIESQGAVEAIEDRGELESEQIPDGDTRTAWEAARGLCADVQLGAALSRLDKLAPLPDRDYPMSGDALADFAAAKRQVRDQLVALKDEYAGENDEEALKNIYGSLFVGSESLFERLRETGNFRPENVNDRTTERRVVHYIAIRAFAAQLCSFPLECAEPATEPVEAGSRVGQALGATESALRCAKDTADRLRDELRDLGISDDCSPDSIPGVAFSGGATVEGYGVGHSEAKGAAVQQDGSDTKRGKSGASARAQKTYSGEPEPDSEAPSMRDFFSILRRVENETDGWLDQLQRDGKRGAHLIRSEVERLAVKAARYRPERAAAGQEMPQVGHLLNLFVGQLERASEEIHKLLDA